MAKTTTVVIYPSKGLLGSTFCVRVYDKTVEEVRAQGRTTRARFDLATEVVGHIYNGVETPQVHTEDIPTELRASWATVYCS